MHQPLPAEVEAAITGYPDAVQERLLELRGLVLDVAAATPAAGRVEETLRWGQPSFVTEPRTGTTVRIDRVRGTDDVAVFTHCRTPLVDECRAAHGDLFDYDGTRGVILRAGRAVPVAELGEHVRAALTYRLRPRAR